MKCSRRSLLKAAMSSSLGLSVIANAQIVSPSVTARQHIGELYRSSSWPEFYTHLQGQGFVDELEALAKSLADTPVFQILDKDIYQRVQMQLIKNRAAIAGIDTRFLEDNQDINRIASGISKKLGDYLGSYADVGTQGLLSNVYFQQGGHIANSYLFDIEEALNPIEDMYGFSHPSMISQCLNINEDSFKRLSFTPRFDVVTLYRTLSQFSHKTGDYLLRQFINALKPGGMLVLIEEAVDSLHAYDAAVVAHYLRQLNRNTLWFEAKAGVSSFHSNHQRRKQLSRSGFTHIETNRVYLTDIEKLSLSFYQKG